MSSPVQAAQDTAPIEAADLPPSQHAGVFAGLNSDALRAVEARFCRAAKRCTFWSTTDSPVAAVGKMVGELLTECDVEARVADAEFVSILAAEKLPVKLNAFRLFRRGQYEPVTVRTQAEWLRRARICVRALLAGTMQQNDDPVRKKLIDRIVRFFFPYDDGTLIKKQDWFFNPAFATFENPMAYREAESELRAMRYFARDCGKAQDCRIVRVSGWDSFWGRSSPGPESPVSVLTAECGAAGVETVFIFPQAKPQAPMSEAEKSAEAFRAAFRDLPRGTVKIIPLPWDFGLTFNEAFEDGRPRISYLTRLLRWNFYRCPTGRDGEITESLLVFRQLVRSDAGNFAFSPAREEIESFSRWLDRVLNFHAKRSTVNR